MIAQFTTDAIFSLIPLVLMEILLGIDNVIFVSIVLDRLPKVDQKKASLIWMIVGIITRLVMLLLLGALLKSEYNLFKIGEHGVKIKDLVMLGGGLFLLVSSTLEIHKKLESSNENEASGSKGKTFGAIIAQIIMIDLIFSLDGVITAFGMTDFTWVRIVAIGISMFTMFYFAPKIAAFIQKHPTFKLLALSFLILISVILISEGINVHTIEIPKGYIYFAMAFSFGVELLNLQFRKKKVEVK